MLRVRAFDQIAVATVLAFLAAGCGGSSNGPERYRVQGKVTYNGEPVPAGRISFEPDASLGNKGPGSLIEFSNGGYRTPSDRGIVGGAYVVRIEGYDGEATTIDGMDLPQGKPLFTPFETKVEFPMENGEHDFEIPAAK